MGWGVGERIFFPCEGLSSKVQKRKEPSITGKNVFLPIEQWASFCSRAQARARQGLIFWC